MELADTYRRIRYTQISPWFIGILIGGPLIICGLLFRTYTVSMASAPWEVARQLGVVFVSAEVGVILYALRHGLDLRAIWLSLPPLARHSLACFVGLFWVGAAFVSELSFLAFAQNAVFVNHLIFCAAIFHLVGPITAPALRKMAGSLAMGLLLFCVMTALAFANHPPLSSMPGGAIEWQFIIPGFISVRLFGAFCGAIYCFMLAQMLLDEEVGNDSYHQYLWLTLCAGMWIWSGTRAAVLGIAVAGLIVLLGYGLRPRKIKTIAALLLSLLISGFVATALIPYGDTAFMLISPTDGSTPDAVSGGRLTYWAAVWEAYLKVPLFGAGPFASFWMLPPGQQIHVQPHNIALQFLITWGLFATVAAFTLLGLAVVKAHLVVRRNRNGLPFLAMLDCLLVMSLVDGTMHFAQQFMLVMICFGVIFNLGRTIPTD